MRESAVKMEDREVGGKVINRKVKRIAKSEVGEVGREMVKGLGEMR